MRSGGDRIWIGVAVTWSVGMLAIKLAYGWNGADDFVLDVVTGGSLLATGIWAMRSSSSHRIGRLLLIAGAAAFGWQQWRAFQQVQEFQDLDAQILSSELPLDAYLDRGFLNWLKDDAEH